jgi:hypothetical protein
MKYRHEEELDAAYEAGQQQGEIWLLAHPSADQARIKRVAKKLAPYARHRHWQRRWRAGFQASAEALLPAVEQALKKIQEEERRDGK